MSAAQWDHKDAWRRRGNGFQVEIVRHTERPSSFSPYEGPNRWCVYAYIYPKHPHFASFQGPNMWQDAATQLHFHGGPSLLEYPMYDSKVACVKVGADYHHLGDDRFTFYSNPVEASEVFADANELFEQLETRAAIAKTQGAAS